MPCTQMDSPQLKVVAQLTALTHLGIVRQDTWPGVVLDVSPLSSLSRLRCLRMRQSAACSRWEGLVAAAAGWGELQQLSLAALRLNVSQRQLLTELVARLPKLEELHLPFAHLLDWRLLAGAPSSLTSLSLGKAAPPVGEAGLEPGALTGLRRLVVSNSEPAGGQQSWCLGAACPQLAELELPAAWTNAACLAGHLPQTLTGLVMTEDMARAPLIAAIAQLQHLRGLVLNVGAHLERADLEPLSQITGLTRFEGRFRSTTDVERAVAVLAGLPALQLLRVGLRLEYDIIDWDRGQSTNTNTYLSDATVALIARMAALRHMTICAGFEITNAQLRELVEGMPGLQQLLLTAPPARGAASIASIQAAADQECSGRAVEVNVKAEGDESMKWGTHNFVNC